MKILVFIEKVALAMKGWETYKMLWKIELRKLMNQSI